MRFFTVLETLFILFYDGGISDVHCDVMYLKQIQKKANVYVFRGLTTFSVNPLV